MTKAIKSPYTPEMLDKRLDGLQAKIEGMIAFGKNDLYFVNNYLVKKKTDCEKCLSFLQRLFFHLNHKQTLLALYSPATELRRYGQTHRAKIRKLGDAEGKILKLLNAKDKESIFKV